MNLSKSSLLALLMAGFAFSYLCNARATNVHFLPSVSAFSEPNIRILPSLENDLLPKSTLIEASQIFSNIIFDVRGSRGGQGDVASGLLSAIDMYWRMKVSGRITLLADETALNILSNMTGSSIIAGETVIDGAISIESIKTLNQAAPPFDLYISLARPDGKLDFKYDFSFGKPGERCAPHCIRMNEKTVLLAQVVLGNSETSRSKNALGLLKLGDSQFPLMRAGLGEGEMGIYYDPVALYLREQSAAEAKRFTINATEDIANPALRDNLKGILSGAYFSGAEMALVYGSTRKSGVEDQFRTYLAGLIEDAHSNSKSFVIVTPSEVDPISSAPPEMKSKITMIDGTNPMPTVPVPGQIYIVKTGRVPHKVFLGLMKLSEVPPILPGDGALSAAICMGIPFISTVVAWNKNNVLNLRDRLLSAVTREEDRILIENIFGVTKVEGGNLAIDARNVLKLKQAHIVEIFRSLIHKIPSLADTMLEVASVARTKNINGFFLGQKYNPVMQDSMIVEAFANGQRELNQRVADLLRKRPAAILEMWNMARKTARPGDQRPVNDSGQNSMARLCHDPAIIDALQTVMLQLRFPDQQDDDYWTQRQIFRSYALAVISLRDPMQTHLMFKNAKDDSIKLADIKSEFNNDQVFLGRDFLPGNYDWNQHFVCPKLMDI